MLLPVAVTLLPVGITLLPVGVICHAGIRCALPNGTVYKTTAFTTPLPFMENGNIDDGERGIAFVYFRG